VKKLACSILKNQALVIWAWTYEWAGNRAAMVALYGGFWKFIRPNSIPTNVFYAFQAAFLKGQVFVAYNLKGGLFVSMV